MNFAPGGLYTDFYDVGAAHGVGFYLIILFHKKCTSVFLVGGV